MRFDQKVHAISEMNFLYSLELAQWFFILEKRKIHGNITGKMTVLWLWCLCLQFLNKQWCMCLWLIRIQFHKLPFLNSRHFQQVASCKLQKRPNITLVSWYHLVIKIQRTWLHNLQLTITIFNSFTNVFEDFVPFVNHSFMHIILTKSLLQHVHPVKVIYLIFMQC